MGDFSDIGSYVVGSSPQEQADDTRARRLRLAREWQFLYATNDQAGLAKFAKQHPKVLKLIVGGKYAAYGISKLAPPPGTGQPILKPGQNPLTTNARSLPEVGANQVRPGLASLTEALARGLTLRSLAAKSAYGAIALSFYDRLSANAKRKLLGGAAYLAGSLQYNPEYLAQGRFLLSTPPSAGTGEPTNTGTAARPSGNQPGSGAPRRATLQPVFPVTRGYLPIPGPRGIVPGGSAPPDRAPAPPDPRLVPGGVVRLAQVKVTAKKIKFNSRTSGTPAKPGVGKVAAAKTSTRSKIYQAFFSGLQKFAGTLPQIGLELARARNRPRAPRFDISPFAYPPPQPAGQPAPLPLTAPEADSAGCNCPKRKAPAERKPREVCYSGRFIERSYGLQKSEKRKVPCRQSRKKRA